MPTHALEQIQKNCSHEILPIPQEIHEMPCLLWLQMKAKCSSHGASQFGLRMFSGRTVADF